MPSAPTPAPAAAAASGGFDDELVAVTPPGAPPGVGRRVDPARHDALERLAGLAAVFGTDEMRARFPDIDWSVTAGNSSQITDGASVLLLMGGRAAAFGLRPRADPCICRRRRRPATHAHRPDRGDDESLGSGRARTARHRHGRGQQTFASVPLAWLAEHPYDEERLNPRGGAIALGHPLGTPGPGS